MTNILAIAHKELKGYFSSPIAYVVVGFSAILFGQFFVGLENARGADDLIQRYGRGEFEFLGEFGEFQRVSLCERDIQMHSCRRFTIARVDRDAHRDPPARDFRQDIFPDAANRGHKLRLRRRVSRGKFIG